MQLTSPVFQEGSSIPSAYTCDGKNINPSLTIIAVPQEAKSLVLIMDDPDVPPHIRKDQMWVHWVVYNIPPSTREIRENSAPGVVGTGTGGARKYQGPCPPDREHRYFFKLYALDTTLPLQGGATKEEVEAEMKGHVKAEAILMGRYTKYHK